MVMADSNQSPDSEHPDVQLIKQAQSGTKAEKMLMRRLDVILRAPVRVHLRRWPGGKLAGLDADDLVHEIFVKLLERDRAVLRKWNVGRGSLEQFVSLFARSRIKDLERKELRRLQLVPHPVALDKAPEPTDVATPDELVMVQQSALRLRKCIEKAITSKDGRKMIELLYDRHLDTDEAVQQSGMTRAQVFRWRSKIFEHARSCLKKHLTKS